MNAQDILWSLPATLGNTWWLICAAFAVPAGMGMFLYMIMNVPFSGLLLARMIIVASMVCFALAPLNSGWIPWGVLFASVGGLYATFLIASDWCGRENKWHDLGAWVRKQIHGNHHGAD